MLRPLIHPIEPIDWQDGPLYCWLSMWYDRFSSLSLVLHVPDACRNEKKINHFCTTVCLEHDIHFHSNGSIDFYSLRFNRMQNLSQYFFLFISSNFQVIDTHTQNCKLIAWIWALSGFCIFGKWATI